MTDSQRLGRRTFLKIAGAAGAVMATPLQLGCGDSTTGGADSTADVGSDVGDASLDTGAPEDALDTADTGGPPVMPKVPVPPELTGDLVDGVRVFKLTLQTGTVEWVPGKPTATYGVNGPVLGPTLRFVKGERVRIEVTNTLDEVTTLHWHGLELPAASDGGPYQTIAPGATWVTEYDIIQRPMMAWYHPHHMHKTARHVYMGMAGMIFIDDPSVSVALPSTYGVDDLPLVIQDRRFSNDGTHPYSAGNSPTGAQRMSGLKGGVILVNGQETPQYELHRGLVRLRILNGSNARNYNVGLSDNRVFQQIASDGGLLAAPIDTTRVLLGPGERAEILVDFSSDTPGDVVGMRSYSGEVVNRIFGGMMGGSGLKDSYDESTFDVMSFMVGADMPDEVIIPPSSFDSIAPPVESDAARTRTIALFMGRGPDTVAINGEQMLDITSVPAAINLRVPAGDKEIWVATNMSGMAHPLHIHNRHFQIIDINGQAPPAYLAGWKDTVLVEPMARIRLMMSFDGTPEPDFPYMFHCHVLEHEDSGMMGQFYIV